MVAPGELRPNIDGDLLLVDRETGEEMAVTVDEAALDRYEKHVRSWMNGIEQVCRGLGVGYVRVLTSVPVEDIVLRDLRRLGLVQ